MNASEAAAATVAELGHKSEFEMFYFLSYQKLVSLINLFYSFLMEFCLVFSFTFGEYLAHAFIAGCQFKLAHFEFRTF